MVALHNNQCAFINCTESYDLKSKHLILINKTKFPIYIKQNDIEQTLIHSKDIKELSNIKISECGIEIDHIFEYDAPICRGYLEIFPSIELNKYTTLKGFKKELNNLFIFF